MERNRVKLFLKKDCKILYIGVNASAFGQNVSE